MTRRWKYLGTISVSIFHQMHRVEMETEVVSQNKGANSPRREVQSVIYLGDM